MAEPDITVTNHQATRERRNAMDKNGEATMRALSIKKDAKSANAMGSSKMRGSLTALPNSGQINQPASIPNPGKR